MRHHSKNNKEACSSVKIKVEINLRLKKTEGKSRLHLSRAVPVEAAPSSHIPARREKGDLERLISLKLSSHPQSQLSLLPSARYRPAPKNSPRIFTGEFPPRSAEQPKTFTHRTCSVRAKRRRRTDTGKETEIGRFCSWRQGNFFLFYVKRFLQEEDAKEDFILRALNNSIFLNICCNSYEINSFKDHFYI